MTICPLMLQATLSRFSQPSSTVGSQQLAFDSYQQFEDSTLAAELLRKQTAEAKTHSFSGGSFDWELLLRRYSDEGRRGHNALKLLSAYFRGPFSIGITLWRPKGKMKCFTSSTHPWIQPNWLESPSTRFLNMIFMVVVMVVGDHTRVCWSFRPISSLCFTK